MSGSRPFGASSCNAFAEEVQTKNAMRDRDMAAQAAIAEDRRIAEAAGLRWVAC